MDGTREALGVRARVVLGVRVLGLDAKFVVRRNKLDSQIF